MTDVLLKLRQLRPVIEASGDSRAIDAYNTAVQAIRRQQSKLVPVTDARQLRVEVDPDRAWEEAIRRAGARLRGEKEAPAAPRLAVQTEDATVANEDEAWGRRMNREGQRRRGEKEPDPAATRRAQDGEESFEETCRRRRRELTER